jgi:selenocysteine lyase/cysteine desulfurase
LKRRSFLQKSTTGLAALVGAGFAPVQAKRSSVPKFKAPQGRIEANDERFWSMVREQFPLTKERIYLNNGSLGPSPYSVIDAVQNKIVDSEVTSESGHQEALWTSIKQKAAQILGCLPTEIAYTRNATEGINIVCNGLPLKRGDEVITTSHEHVGNTITWLARKKRDGIALKIFEPSTQSAQENLDGIERLVTSKTRAISVPHITTTTGQILPVRDRRRSSSRNAARQRLGNELPCLRNQRS